ncbi:MAG TPA: cupredoxin domain-containing protein [Methylomirabilota bacterium]|nr:cupredoxin domain-containing protein [Methylomirabilota bacterium]
MKRLVLSLGLVAVAVISVACSSGSSGSTPAPAGSAAPSAAAGDGIVVVAKDIAFATASIKAPAGEGFQILLDNQDSAPHNVAIKDASGAEKFKGEIITATKITYNVAALPAGAYTFWCEVHPNMTGTLTVQ